MAKDIRIGLIARMDNGGLGIQTHELYKHLKPARTFVIDMHDINAEHGKKTVNFPDRYPNAMIIDGFPRPEQMEEMLKDIDVLISVEIPYGYELFELARQRGVKTVLQYNYEFLDYLQTPTLPEPDLFLAPSQWHIEDVEVTNPVEYLHVPVNRELIPYKHRQFGNKFVHIAGQPTHADRNGTEIVLESLKWVDTEIQLVIHTQNKEWLDQLLENYTVPNNVRLKIVDIEVKEYQDIYNNPYYDVVLLPRRYGGLSLQLNEALSAGLPVIMSNISPQDKILPEQALVDASEGKIIHTRTNIQTYDVEPIDLAKKIDELHENPEIVSYLSNEANKYAKQIDWKIMAPLYIERLEKLCQQ